MVYGRTHWKNTKTWRRIKTRNANLNPKRVKLWHMSYTNSSCAKLFENSKSVIRQRDTCMSHSNFCVLPFMEVQKEQILV